MDRTEWAEVSPELAEDLLGKNFNNRNISQRRVSRIAADMKAGKFRGGNGETIKLTSDGRLMDGQHRLLAIIASDTTQGMLFVHGVDEEDQTTIDTGASRTIGHVLAMKGERASTQLGATLNIIRYYKGYPDASRDATHAEILEALEKHPEVRESLQDAYAMNKACRAVLSGLAAGIHLVREVNADTDRFEQGITTGEMLTVGDPRLLFRDRVASMIYAGNVRRNGWAPRLRTTHAYIKTWNNWVDGETVSHLRIAPNEKLPRVKVK